MTAKEFFENQSITDSKSVIDKNKIQFNMEDLIRFAEAFADVSNEVKTTELITEKEDIYGVGYAELKATKCCGIAPITNENYCPNCGRKIIK